MKNILMLIWNILVVSCMALLMVKIPLCLLLSLPITYGEMIVVAVGLFSLMVVAIKDLDRAVNKIKGNK